jgi:acetolactate synthase-1/2/3 large subunit
MVTDTVSAVDQSRIAHQRVDQLAMFAPVTKAALTAGGIGDTATACRQAVAVATSHPRGAVHLNFDPGAEPSWPPANTVRHSTANELAAALELVAAASRPVVVLGVGARDVVAEVRELLRDSVVPVLTTYRAKGVIPDSWTNAAGLMTAATAEAPVLHAADLIIMIGIDSVEFFPGQWPYAAPVVAFGSWPEHSVYYSSTAEVVGHLPDLVAALAAAWPETSWSQGAGNEFRDHELARMRAAGSNAIGLRPQQVVDAVRDVAPVGTIATIDAGAHMLPATVLWPVQQTDETVVSSGLVTMGFALPAAIGAALARPQRRVVCFTGDGGLGMCLAELETLQRLNLDVTVVVFNDSLLSLIAIKAKPEGQGGSGAVQFRQTDFAQIAAGFGIDSISVTNASEVTAAITTALARPGPMLIDARVDPSGYKEIMDVVRGPRP